jgi:hypothetical protein
MRCVSAWREAIRGYELAMTPAELLVILDQTGLTQAEAARYCGIEPRSISRYLNLDRAIGPDVAQRLLDLRREQDQAAAVILERWKRRGKPDTVMVVYREQDHDPKWTGWPTSGVHVALVRRLMSSGMPVTVHLFDPTDYTTWRRGRTDTEERRTAWATNAM